MVEKILGVIEIWVDLALMEELLWGPRQLREMMSKCSRMIRVPNIFPRGCEVRQGKAPKDLILAQKVLNTPSRSLSFSLKK